MVAGQHLDDVVKLLVQQVELVVYVAIDIIEALIDGAEAAVHIRPQICDAGVVVDNGTDAGDKDKGEREDLRVRHFSFHLSVAPRQSVALRFEVDG